MKDRLVGEQLWGLRQLVRELEIAEGSWGWSRVIGGYGSYWPEGSFMTMILSRILSREIVI